MKKRKLISFFTAVCILAVTFLASCESGSGVIDITNRKAAMLVIYYQVEDSTTPEAIAMVERELNFITEGKFTTRIRLVGLKKNEYEAAVDRAFAAYDVEQQRLAEIASSIRVSERASREQAKADRAAGIPTVRTQRPTEPPRTTALYTERIQWPEIKNEQIDIFLITSSEMFERLVQEDRLATLDDELNTKAKILREYIHPSTMMAGQHNDRTFAIPTNKMIGEATYLAVNKRLAEKYELDISRVRDWRDLTEWLETVKANERDIAMVENGPVYPTNYEAFFPEFENFAIQAAGGRTLVYMPEQAPTEAPARAAAPQTDEEGNAVAEDATTIPATTLAPKPIPARTITEPDPITVSNMYTSSLWAAYAALNQEWREKGLFESNAPADKERAVYQITGTLVDKIEYEQRDLANGYEYEYLTLVNPRATKEDLRNGMYAVSVSTPNVGRAMEIVTLLNTNKQFKNIFTYGVEGEHFIFNEDRQIERIHTDYMVNTDYTGNHFIADLLAGENPRKWDIAKQHNLEVINSVFLKFNFDRSKLSAESLGSLGRINTLSQEVRRAYLNGLPAGYATWDDYIYDYVTPEFENAGAPDLIRNIREQTSPE